MHSSSQAPLPSALTLRVAGPADARAVLRLAALDSACPPPSPVLMAEVDGELWAAVSLRDLRAVADPFRLSAPVLAMAQARAAQLRDGGEAPHLWRAGRSRVLRPQRAT